MQNVLSQSEARVETRSQNQIAIKEVNRGSGARTFLIARTRKLQAVADFEGWSVCVGGRGLLPMASEDWLP